MCSDVQMCFCLSTNQKIRSGGSLLTIHWLFDLNQLNSLSISLFCLCLCWSSCLSVLREHCHFLCVFAAVLVWVVVLCRFVSVFDGCSLVTAAVVTVTLASASVRLALKKQQRERERNILSTRFLLYCTVCVHCTDGVLQKHWEFFPWDGVRSSNRKRKERREEEETRSPLRSGAGSLCMWTRCH